MCCTKVYFASKALVIKDNKFLALFNKTIEGVKWDLPGGRMKFGENAEETLYREIIEELGVEVLPIRLIDTWNYIVNEEKMIQITGVIYYCKLNCYDIKLSDEHDGYQWFDIGSYNKEFNQNVFSERMEKWNWATILDCNTPIVKYE